eukprot:1738389-Prymnesium_polylepis.1
MPEFNCTIYQSSAGSYPCVLCRRAARDEAPRPYSEVRHRKGHAPSQTTSTRLMAPAGSSRIGEHRDSLGAHEVPST